MREVKYNFNGQIQDMPVYTRREVIDALNIRVNDSYGQSYWIEYAMGRMNPRISRREKLRTLAKSTAKLKNMLKADEYLYIEVSNIACTLLTPELLAETIINQRQLWNNVEK